MYKKQSIIFYYLFSMLILLFIIIISVSTFFDTNIYVVFFIFYILSIILCITIPKVFDIIFDTEAFIRLTEKLDSDKWYEVSYVSNNYIDKVMYSKFNITKEEIKNSCFEAMLDKTNNIIIKLKFNKSTSVWITKSYYLFEQSFEFI